MENGITISIEASENGYTEIVSMLLDKGADVNKTVDGDTALMKANDYRHIEIVPMLLNNGADVNAKNNRGQTALIKLSIYGYRDRVKSAEEGELM